MRLPVTPDGLTPFGIAEVQFYYASSDCTGPAYAIASPSFHSSNLVEQPAAVVGTSVYLWTAATGTPLAVVGSRSDVTTPADCDYGNGCTTVRFIAPKRCCSSFSCGPPVNPATQFVPAASAFDVINLGSLVPPFHVEGP